MAKVDIQIVSAILRRNNLEGGVVEKIINEIQRENAALAAEEEPKPPAVKKQYVILLSDPEAKIPAGEDFTGWVLQIPENDSPAVAEERIRRAAYNFNTSRKGRKLPVFSIGEACENVSARFFKDEDVAIKTKTPVLVMRTNNEIPQDGKGKPGE